MYRPQIYMSMIQSVPSDILDFSKSKVNHFEFVENKCTCNGNVFVSYNGTNISLSMIFNHEII